jgi:hypothetical protein
MAAVEAAVTSPMITRLMKIRTREKTGGIERRTPVGDALQRRPDLELAGFGDAAGQTLLVEEFAALGRC